MSNFFLTSLAWQFFIVNVIFIVGQTDITRYEAIFSVANELAVSE